MNIKNFGGITPFEKKVWLASPTMHGEEQKWISDAFAKNWVTCLGDNINEVERQMCKKIGVDYAIAMSSGTAALHLAMRLCGEKLYGKPKAGHGALEGRKVFCSDLTFAATVNPVAYEGGEPVFIDTEYDTWNMDPIALERAFELYPEVRLVVLVHLYGTPAKLDEIRAICKKHKALLVEDAAESLGSTYKGKETGGFGAVSVISYNGNKIITGSSGGMMLTNSLEEAQKARKWATQSREMAPWYQHEDMGYNYRMSNIIAGVVRGQIPYLDKHIARKKAIFERYQKGLADLPICMNPCDEKTSVSNYWLSCMIIDEQAMCQEFREESKYSYISEQGKSCPMEILDTFTRFNVEGRPIWKPMHMQPTYRDHAFVTAKAEESAKDVGADIFARGLCLPSDINMTDDEQDVVIEIIRRCFDCSPRLSENMKKKQNVLMKIIRRFFS